MIPESSAVAYHCISIIKLRTNRLLFRVIMLVSLKRQITFLLTYNSTDWPQLKSQSSFALSQKNNELEKVSPSAAPHSIKKPFRRPERSLSTSADWPTCDASVLFGVLSRPGLVSDGCEI